MTRPSFDVYAYGPKSLSGVIMRAREMAVHGATGEQIAKALDVHIVAAEFVVWQWEQHRDRFLKVVGE